MKKLLLTSFVLLLSFVAQAQVKVVPKLVKGYQATYVETSTIGAADDELKSVSETTYTVTDVTADGAVIEVIMNVVSGFDGEDPTSKLMKLAQGTLDGQTLKVATDATGKAIKILNYDEVQEKAKSFAEKAINQLIESTPALAQLPKEALLEQITSRMTEETILESFEVLALNGKSIANGAQEEFTKEGMKMKRMYFVTGKSIICNSSLNMTKDELKQFIIDQVTKEAPEQAEMVKQNIDMILGQIKMEMTEKTTYELQDNGWVKSIKSESKQNLMGQEGTSSTVITLK